MYGDQFGEFLCGYWGLKGYRDIPGAPNDNIVPNHLNIALLNVF